MNLCDAGGGENVQTHTNQQKCMLCACGGVSVFVGGQPESREGGRAVSVFQTT